MALEHDLDVTRIRSNTFSLEWPRRSGNIREYPEIDEGRWFRLGDARQKVTAGRAGFLDRLL
jgi:predicted NUDIX family NTP pyrophosphohydrolase